jgi:hypothetical protein
VNLTDLGDHEVALATAYQGVVYPDANTVPDTIAGCLLRLG